MEGKWLRKPSGDTTAVFVHGILSSGERCWQHKNGTYWPGLLVTEQATKDLGIYVFTYRTDKFSGSYRLGDAVDSLNEHLGLDGVLKSNRIIFVCHSMGGIVIRKFLVDRQVELIEKDAQIGLFLIASPSLGAKYANLVTGFLRVLGIRHAQAEALRFEQTNAWLNDLDKNFKNLKEAKKLSITGKELVEDTPILFKKWWWWRKQVVEPISGAIYFGEPYKVPHADHFSIAKPASRDVIQHRLLTKFIVEFSVGESTNKPSDTPVNIAKLPTDKNEILGREPELKMLNKAWSEGTANVICLVAWGGVGKTALITAWIHRLERINWGGAYSVFGWSFYSLHTMKNRRTSVDLFFNQALRFFGYVGNSMSSSWDNGIRLAELICKHRMLLILDGLEPLQSPPGYEAGGKIEDQGIEALLKQLAANNPGLCVITTRQKVADLSSSQTDVISYPLDDLSEKAGISLLKRLKVEGPEDELTKIVTTVKGHAFTLNLFGRFVAVVHGGDIRRMLNFASVMEVDEAKKKTKEMLLSYENWFEDKPELSVLYLMGLFDKPVEANFIESVRVNLSMHGPTDRLGQLPVSSWKFAIRHLHDLGLLSELRDNQGHLFDCHALVREYFGEIFRTKHPFAWRETHNQLFECYKGRIKTKPKELIDLEPALAAVYHGCQAGRQKEALNDVYYKTISLKEECFLAKKLGAYSTDLNVLANFFAEKWTTPIAGLFDSDDADRSVLFNWVAFSLRAIGLLHQSVEAFQAAFDESKDRRDWKGAAIDCSNLSETYMLLGDLGNSVEYAENGLEHARKSVNENVLIHALTTLADALHQSGRLEDSEKLFLEAERKHTKLNPTHPMLYAWRGYRYCQLLLAQGDYAEAIRRTTKTIEWGKDGGLGRKTIALDKLVLGQAYLLKSDHEISYSCLEEAESFLQEALEELRLAQTQHDLAQALLVRAALYRRQKKYCAAIHDLEETRELAKRNEMRLYHCDYLTESARIALASDDIEEAKRLVASAMVEMNTMGYFRLQKPLDDLMVKLSL